MSLINQLIITYSISAELAKGILASATVRVVNRHDLIKVTGDKMSDVLFPLEGVFAVEAPFNKESSLYTSFFPGILINECNQLTKNRRPESIKAVTDGRLLRLPEQSVKILQNKSIEFNQLISHSLAKKLSVTSIILFLRSEKNHHKRILGIISAIAQLNPTGQVHMNLRNLASLAGCSRNTMATVVKDLDNRGDITVNRSMIVLNKPHVDWDSWDI